MQGYYSLVAVSGDRKTGPMPVTYHPRPTCWDGCAFKGDKGCMSEVGHIPIHWNHIDKETRGLPWKEYIAALTRLGNVRMRMTIAGDIPHKDGEIIDEKFYQLVKALKGKEAIWYTHHPITGHNIRLIRYARDHGITINASFERQEEAAIYKLTTGLPAVSTITLGQAKVSYSKGIKVVRCPATKDNNVTCSTCNLCTRGDRDYIIGFTPIGARKNKVDIIARSSI